MTTFAMFNDDLRPGILLKISALACCARPSSPLFPLAVASNGKRISFHAHLCSVSVSVFTDSSSHRTRIGKDVVGTCSFSLLALTHYLPFGEKIGLIKA
jgi:hypothetical protein